MPEKEKAALESCLESGGDLQMEKTFAYFGMLLS
jgi:hypothetical protein